MPTHPDDVVFAGSRRVGALGAEEPVVDRRSVGHRTHACDRCRLRKQRCERPEDGPCAACVRYGLGHSCIRRRYPARPETPPSHDSDQHPQTPADRSQEEDDIGLSSTTGGQPSTTTVSYPIPTSPDSRQHRTSHRADGPHFLGHQVPETRVFSVELEAEPTSPTLMSIVSVHALISALHVLCGCVSIDGLRQLRAWMHELALTAGAGASFVILTYMLYRSVVRELSSPGDGSPGLGLEV